MHVECDDRGRRRTGSDLVRDAVPDGLAGPVETAELHGRIAVRIDRDMRRRMLVEVRREPTGNEHEAEPGKLAFPGSVAPQTQFEP